MEVKMKRLGAMHYTKDGEEDGCDHTYEMVEVPDEIVKKIIVDIFSDNYEIFVQTGYEIVNDFDMWDELEEKYEDEIKEKITYDYTIDELKKGLKND